MRHWTEIMGTLRARFARLRLRLAALIRRTARAPARALGAGSAVDIDIDVDSAIAPASASELAPPPSPAEVRGEAAAPVVAGPSAAPSAASVAAPSAASVAAPIAASVAAPSAAARVGRPSARADASPAAPAGIDALDPTIGAAVVRRFFTRLASREAPTLAGDGWATVKVERFFVALTSPRPVLARAAIDVVRSEPVVLADAFADFVWD